MKLRSIVLLILIVQFYAAAQEKINFDDQFKHAAVEYGGRLGVAAKNIATGETILYNADTLFPTASVIKLPVLVELFYKFHEGKLSPHQPVVLLDSLKKPGNGVLQFLEPNQTQR